jgi:diketogulonate reductase-like aldo/keto reductase
MLFKRLGGTGIQIPELGIGTHDYRAGPGPLRRGLERGALFIDTAESYDTEAVVGEAVRGMRDRVFIATKVSPQHYRAQDLRRSVWTPSTCCSSTTPTPRFPSGTQWTRSPA